jgi:hypothetical protein
MKRADCILFSALFSACCAFAQTPTLYKISGVVLDHRTQAPLSSVLVSIAPVDFRNNGGEQLAVTTGGDGRFEFTDLSAGKYALLARRRGGKVHALQENGGFSTAIAAGPGRDSEHIVFPLPAECRLSGLVVDDDGDPVPNAQVYLLSNEVRDGKRSVSQQTQQNTGSSGAFRFTHLKPGSYYLAVSARPWYAGNIGYATFSRGGATTTQRIDPPAILDMAYPITYSGDTADPAAAQPIVLTEGGEVTSQIDLHAAPAVHISVPVPEAVPNSVPPRRMVSQLELTEIGPGDVRLKVQAQFGLAPPGYAKESEEQISGIAPGVYRLQRGEGGLQVTSEEQLIVGVGGAAAVTPVAGVRVQGKVVYDGVLPKQNITLQMTGEGKQAYSQIQKDGSFVFPTLLQPGHYQIALSDDDELLMVRSIATGNPARVQRVLEVPNGGPNPQEVTVTIGRNSTSELSGVAMRDGRPVAGAMVLLVPAASDQGAPIGRDQSDSDGTFSIRGVPAGHYTLLAIDPGNGGDPADLPYQDAAVLKPYLAHGQPVVMPVAKPIAIEVTARTGGAS